MAKKPSVDVVPKLALDNKETKTLKIPTIRIPTTYRVNVICTAVRYGAQKEFDFVLKQYYKTNITDVKRDLSAGLACTKETWLMNKYLNELLEANNGDKVLEALRNLAKQSTGTPFAWSFFNTNWNTIYKK